MEVAKQGQSVKPRSDQLARLQINLGGEDVCKRCVLHEQRNKVVLAEGSLSADIMFIGEAPGFNEDKTGHPFLGKAGHNLDVLLEFAGVSRDRVIVTNMIQCLRGSAKIYLEDGTLERVNKIVKDKYSGKVLSISGEGQIVARTVTNWYKSPLSGRKMYKVSYIDAKANSRGQVGVVVTGDHLLLTHRGWIKTEDITNSDRINTGTYAPNTRQEQLLLMAVLGDAGFDRSNSTVTFCHGHKQYDYLLLKRQLLTSLLPTDIRIRTDAVSGFFRVPAHRAFGPLLTQSVLDCVEKLDDFGVALWYMDDGHLSRRPGRQPHAEICVTRFDDDTVDGIVKRLRDKGFSCYRRRDHSGNRIKFNVDETKNLCARISKFVPEVMRYKLSDTNVQYDATTWESTEAEMFYSPVIVTEVPITKEDTSVYCIDVEGTHNFITPGGVVHNCAPWEFKERIGKWEIGKPKKKPHIDPCSYWLDRKILESNVSLVIPLGDYAMKKFLPGRTLKASHGRVFEVDFESQVPDLPEDCPSSKKLLVMPQYHPAAALHNPAIKKTLVLDYRRIPDAINLLPEKPDTTNYRLVTTWEELLELDRTIRETKKFSFDYETTGLDPHTDTIVGVAISTELGKSWYIPTFDDFLDVNEVMNWLAAFLLDPEYEVVAHNLKFEISMSMPYLFRYVRAHGADELFHPLITNAFDTMVALYLLRSEIIDLKNAVLRVFNVLMGNIDPFLGKGKNQKTMLDASREDLMAVKDYACADADFTLRLHEFVNPLLVETDTWDLYTEIELPVVPILADMEMTGAIMDQDYVKELDEFYKQKAEESRLAVIDEVRRILDIDISEINLNAPREVSELLFDKLMLKPPKVNGRYLITTYGYFSTDGKKVLDQMDSHPVLDAIKDYKTWKKLLGYTTAMMKPHEVTNRIHTNFNQARTQSSRLSSSSPINFQNIPSRLEMSKLLRKCFISLDGWLILRADWNQMELRIETHFSQDPVKLEIFKAGGDIHAETNIRFFGHLPDFEEHKDMYRKRTKQGNFGYIYRVLADTMSRLLDISKEEAQSFINAQRKLYAGSESYFHEYVGVMAAMGYATTLYGMRRYLPNLSGTSPGQIAAAQREGFNHRIQGTGAGMAKKAMIRLWRAMREARMESKFYIQVHDELVFYVKPSELVQLYDMISFYFTDFPEMTVPITTTIEIGNNWLDGEEITREQAVEIAAQAA